MSDKVLIAYFSHSGNTQRIAELIQELTGGALHRIEPEQSYPTSYNLTVDQAKKEIKTGFKPTLKSSSLDLGAYDTIFIGSPNWWSTIAPPIATFLSDKDLSGKTVIPFCTHGGGSLGKLETAIKELCPQSTVLDIYGTFGDGGSNAEDQVRAWISKLRLNDE